MCTNSPQCFILTLQGQLVRRFASGKKEGSGGDFNCATVSPQGMLLFWVYLFFVFIIFFKTGSVVLGHESLCIIAFFLLTLIVCNFYLALFFIFSGKWLYCVGEDGVMYIFDARSGQLENTLQVT